MLENILQERLQAQQQANLYRTRQIFSSFGDNKAQINGKPYITFCSNDYLGLANHISVIEAFKKGAEKYGLGSSASYLVTGYRHAHRELEDAFSEFLQRDKAILFSTGYMANIGVIQALTRANDIIYEDKLNHASLIDAGLLANTKLKRYKHNDLLHLKALLLQQTTGHKLIVTDSVFSMDGDLAFLPDLSKLATNNSAWLMVDDAHGIGILGREGRGITEYFDLTQNDIPILVCPLGKAFGCFGAIVSGSRILIENLIQFSRTYVYTTAIPPAIAVAAKTSLEIIRDETWRREKLQSLINYFKEGTLQRNLNFELSYTPIQAFIVGNAANALQLSQQLFANGLLVTAIRPPTVPVNTARLRITLNCNHQKDQIDKLLDCLMKAYENLQYNHW